MDVDTSSSRPLIWRNHYRKRAGTQLYNQRSFANTRRKQAVDRPISMEHLYNRQSFAKTRNRQAVDRPVPMEIDEWISISGNLNATTKHSRNGACKFGGSPLNWRRNSAIHVGGRPARNNISPSCHHTVNSRPNFCSKGRTKRRRNDKYSTELDGEIEKETSYDWNRKADLPFIAGRLPEINPWFTCMRRWDECTQSEASCSPLPAKKFSSRFCGFDSDSGDDRESMDIDNEYITHDVGDMVVRALLEDIEEKLGDLDVYTADDVSEHCTQPLKGLCL